MEGPVGSCLFESVDRGIHGLSSSGEGAGGQHLHLLGMSYFGAGVDDLLSDFLELVSEGSELKNFAFDEGVPQLVHRSVNKELVGLSGLEDALSEGIEGGLRTITRSGPQLDCEHRVAFTHGEVGAWTGVVEYEPYIFGFTLVVVGIVDRRRDAESSVGSVFDKRGSWMRVVLRFSPRVPLFVYPYDILLVTFSKCQPQWHVTVSTSYIKRTAFLVTVVARIPLRQFHSDYD